MLEQELILLIVAKKVQKRSILTEGKGIPLSVTVDGANRHDKMLVKKTLDAIIFKRPFPDGGFKISVWIRGLIILVSENWLKNMDILRTFGDGEKKT